ncbi:predicted protein [Lichtheimia corymbifera JMRC:FSU:9682]|uniref:Uncharacterized protein n=1 Tax=Lichtheimia corymbifera JMRC:FSU:9682 TaxID=1263082 RepID=A0A068RYA6_9FUNG|nr:predicted protein [Lichtheimia corymbifera JMRC:FSU:9682]
MLGRRHSLHERGSEDEVTTQNWMEKHEHPRTEWIDGSFQRVVKDHNSHGRGKFTGRIALSFDTPLLAYVAYSFILSQAI